MSHRDQAPGDDRSGAPQTARQIPAGDLVLEISHAQMNTAYDNGEAVPFTQAVPWLVRYDGSWWVVYERGWLRVTDEPTAADLDQRAAQVTEVEVTESRDAAIRNAIAARPTTDATGRPPVGS